MWGTCLGSCAGLSPPLGDPLWSRGSVGVSLPWTGGAWGLPHTSVSALQLPALGVERIRLLSLSFGHVPGLSPSVLAAHQPWRLHHNFSQPLLPSFLSEMFDKQQANTIFWSPQGQFVVLAGLRRWVSADPRAALWAAAQTPTPTPVHASCAGSDW